MERTSRTRLSILLLFITVIIGLRVIAPLSPDFKALANFSGLGAVAIFSGSYFRNKFSAYIFPMLVLLLSDLALGIIMGTGYVFYQGWYFTYIAFAAMIVVGQTFVKSVNVQNVALASVVGVFIHWIVADFGVWLGSPYYPQTFAGFAACLIAAVPFELKFLYGTVFYAALMFSAFEMLKTKFPALNQKTALA